MDRIEMATSMDKMDARMEKVDANIDMLR